jgi:hypothetical protein
MSTSADLGIHEASEPVACFDCRVFELPTWQRAGGHTGMHPWNLASYLLCEDFRQFRFKIYETCFRMVFSRRVSVTNASSVVVFCEKGTHRSMGGSYFVAVCLRALGWSTCVEPICYLWHLKQNCQRGGIQSCPLCNEDNADVHMIGQQIRSEFFEYLLTTA